MFPLVNTHIHIPPNFSAFRTPDAVVDAAVAEGIRAIGVSNFYDQSVYGLIRSAAREADITAMFGLEFITLIPELEEAGIRINDPSNPGRMYLTGKGINPFKPRSPRAEKIATAVRKDNDQRSHRMIALVAEHFGALGFDTMVTPRGLVEDVAARGGVPVEWVSLQERHIAMAFQEAVFRLPLGERVEMLDKAYGRPCDVDVEDPVALQTEIRSRLLKKGTPGFVAEVALSFQDAYNYILDMGGIPCYPVLADGADPVCPFEESPTALAEALLERGIHAAEFIPNRNYSFSLNRYVQTLHDHGILVMAGTEHNTWEQIPLAPRCMDGPLSDYTQELFYEGACVVAAHSARAEWAKPGYVDGKGKLVKDLSHRVSLINEGDHIIGGGEWE
ncbi:MAG: hypothetical protein LBN10_05765 [Propionibacteriaceae bacterium]|jgi:hypothetical protein|nr:hypothetical protein [Propionibacteriaceae bacterium]